MREGEGEEIRGEIGQSRCPGGIGGGAGGAGGAESGWLA